MNNILHESLLETYNFAEKNKKYIVEPLSMFLPKELNNFIFKEKINFTYYSVSELKNMKKEKKINKNKKTYNSTSLLESISTSKIHYLIQFIPENLLYFIIFISYTTLHSILFFSFILILLLVTNISHLFICLLILIINLFGIIAFSNCPIHILEKRYRKKITDNQTFLCNIIKKIYDTHVNPNFEESIQLLVTAIFFCFIKINLIILYKYFMISSV